MFLDHTQLRTTVGTTPLDESYRLLCVVLCDLETSRMGAPNIYIYIYYISRLRVNDLNVLLYGGRWIFLGGVWGVQQQVTVLNRTEMYIVLHDCCILAGLERHQRRDYCCCEQRLPLCWTEVAAPWISQQLGLLLFHIAVWFRVLQCFVVSSAYWQ